MKVPHFQWLENAGPSVDRSSWSRNVNCGRALTNQLERDYSSLGRFELPSMAQGNASNYPPSLAFYGESFSPSGVPWGTPLLQVH